MNNEPQPRYDAFRAGEAAFFAGQSDVAPYSDLELAHEWTRGYRNARKAARFNATIAARQSKTA